MSLTAHLSAQRIPQGKVVTLQKIATAAGTDASAVVVIPLGRLYLRGFKHWVPSLSLDHPHRGLSELCGSTSSVEAQYICCNVHQPSGWTPDPSSVHTGSQTDFVEQCAPPVTQRHSPPGTLWGRLAFQRRCSSWGMESPSGVYQSDLGTLWSPPYGSAHLK